MADTSTDKMTPEKYLEIMRGIIAKQPSLGIDGCDYDPYGHDRANLLNEKHLKEFSTSLQYLRRVLPHWRAPMSAGDLASLIEKEEKVKNIPLGIAIAAAIHVGLGVRRLSRLKYERSDIVIFWDRLATKMPEGLAGAV
jgi:hypothetical protein